MIWSHLEGSLAIIACNLPPLQKLFKQFFRSAISRTGNTRSTPASGTQLSHLTPMDGQRTGGSRMGISNNWDRISDTEDDHSSKRGIVRQTSVRVETSSVEPRDDRSPAWETSVKPMV